MRRGLPLKVAGVVSPQLLANSGAAQDILAAFLPGKLHRTSIATEQSFASTSVGAGVGSFFSGGVDSLHTALRRDGELSHLVFVHGFDIIESNTPRATAGIEAARRWAASKGKQLIEVETNIREVTDRFAPWIIAHGPALATTALLLQVHLSRVLVPSSFAYQYLLPWGSHPLLDPLWGTETLAIVHDGCDATRVQKVATIAASDEALRELRVCNYQHPTYNCGQCEKCLRTTVNLQLVGALGRCPTLPSSVRLVDVARVHLTEPGAEPFWREIRTAAWAKRDWPMAVATSWLFRPRPLMTARTAYRRIRHELAQFPRARRLRALVQRSRM